MTVGIAIIGCGLIGRKRALALPSGARVVSVHDRVPHVAQALARELPDEPLVASSPHAAVNAAGVDVVVVATTHDALVTTASEGLACGRDVLVEKPGGRSLAEVEQLAALAASVGRRVWVGYNHRFHPSIDKLLELTSGDAYGRLLHMRGRYGHGGRPGYEHEWRADKARSGGGELLDQGSHLIDLFCLVAGSADLSFAELRTSFWSMEVEDNAFLALRSRNGAFGWLHASWTEWKNLFSLELTYEYAKLEVTGLGGSYGAEQLRLYAMTKEMGPPPMSAWEWPGADRSWEAEMADVLASHAGGPGRSATLDDAVAVMRIIDAAYRCSFSEVGTK